MLPYLLGSEKFCATECLSGYFYSTTNADYKCLLCDSNCKTCEGSYTYCTSCKSNTYLENGKCENSC
jgi:hypothetical protein